MSEEISWFMAFHFYDKLCVITEWVFLYNTFVTLSFLLSNDVLKKKSPWNVFDSCLFLWLYKYSVLQTFIFWVHIELENGFRPICTRVVWRTFLVTNNNYSRIIINHNYSSYSPVAGSHNIQKKIQK